MKKYIFILMIIFSAVISANEFGGKIIQIDTDNLFSTIVLEHQAEEEISEFTALFKLNDGLVLISISTVNTLSALENNLPIWKPPVNA